VIRRSIVESLRVNLREVNSAIREGFQSVVDSCLIPRWPSSPDIWSLRLINMLANSPSLGFPLVHSSSKLDGSIPMAAKRDLLEMTRTKQNGW